MNIRPVSGIGIYNSNIHFTSRKKENIKAEETNNSQAPLKAVPVALMMAMLPMAANAQMENPEKLQDVKNEHFDRGHGLSVTRRTKILSNQQSMIFTMLNSDKNKKDSEIIGFKYREKDDMPEYKTGIIQAICEDKNSDDRYIITYRPTGNDVPNYVRLCSVPKEFGKYIMEFAKSSKNNEAVDIASRQDFEEAFGIANVEGASPIEEVAPAESNDKSWDNVIFLLDFNK